MRMQRYAVWHCCGAFITINLCRTVLSSFVHNFTVSSVISAHSSSMLKDMAFSFFLSFLTGGASVQNEKNKGDTAIDGFQKIRKKRRQAILSHALHTRASCTAAAAGRWPLGGRLAIHVLPRFGLNLFGQRIGQARRFCQHDMAAACE